MLLTEGMRDYPAREVQRHVPDAWLDEAFPDERGKESGRVGYEINFNRDFYKYSHRANWPTSTPS